MGSSTSLESNTALNVSTNVLQRASNSCNMTCSQTLSDITVIISGGSTVGDVTFSQVCSITNSRCVFKTTFDANLSTILDSVAKQTSTTATPIFAMPSFTNTSQTNNINETISNSIAQLVSNSCSFSTQQTMTSNYVFFGSGSKGGDISFAQQGSISGAECNMDVVAKAIVYNDAKASSDQSGGIFSSSGLIAMAIIFCIVMGVIILVVFILAGAVSKIAKARKNLLSPEKGSAMGEDDPTDVLSKGAGYLGENPEKLNKAFSAFVDNPQIAEAATHSDEA